MTVGAGPARVEDVTVEPMRWWDIEQVTALEQVLFPGDSPWTAAMFWSELAAGHHYVVHREPSAPSGERPEPSATGGATSETPGESSAATAEVLGYAGLAVGADGADVQTIGVAPQAQHRGIGRALLGDLLIAAGRLPVMLEVRCDNAPAIALYESEGFSRIGRRRRYYQPSGADAYTMLRPSGGSK